MATKEKVTSEEMKKDGYNYMVTATNNCGESALYFKSKPDLNDMFAIEACLRLNLFRAHKIPTEIVYSIIAI